MVHRKRMEYCGWILHGTKQNTLVNSSINWQQKNPIDRYASDQQWSNIHLSTCNSWSKACSQTPHEVKWNILQEQHYQEIIKVPTKARGVLVIPNNKDTHLIPTLSFTPSSCERSSGLLWSRKKHAVTVGPHKQTHTHLPVAIWTKNMTVSPLASQSVPACLPVTFSTP